MMLPRLLRTKNLENFQKPALILKMTRPTVEGQLEIWRPAQLFPEGPNRDHFEQQMPAITVVRAYSRAGSNLPRFCSQEGSPVETVTNIDVATERRRINSLSRPRGAFSHEPIDKDDNMAVEVESRARATQLGTIRAIATSALDAMTKRDYEVACYQLGFVFSSLSEPTYPYHRLLKRVGQSDLAELFLYAAEVHGSLSSVALKGLFSSIPPAVSEVPALLKRPNVLIERHMKKQAISTPEETPSLPEPAPQPEPSEDEEEPQITSKFLLAFGGVNRSTPFSEALGKAKAQLKRAESSPVKSLQFPHEQKISLAGLGVAEYFEMIAEQEDRVAPLIMRLLNREDMAMTRKIIDAANLFTDKLNKDGDKAENGGKRFKLDPGLASLPDAFDRLQLAVKMYGTNAEFDEETKLFGDVLRHFLRSSFEPKKQNG